MITGKKIAIFGFGLEGASAANHLAEKNRVYVVDEKPESIAKKESVPLSPNAVYYFGGNIPENINFDYIIRSPGVRPDNPLLLKLTTKNTIVTSATKIFFDECPCAIIGVTGTKGKGTTSTLIYEMLKNQGKDVYLAGNIGIPALDVLNNLKSSSIVVLELSSFQLIDLKKSPHIAVILMVTSEHLDWHSDVSEYQQAKKAIVKNQSENDFTVINADYPASVEFAKYTKAKKYFFSTANKTDGAYLEGNEIISQINSRQKIANTADVFLPGRHNLQNVLAATLVAKILEVTNNNIVKVLKTFKGLEHRLELVRELNGVAFYNDSFSTTPETTIAAIEAFKSPKILILGGSSKNSDFSALGEKISTDKSVKAIILIGKEAGRIKDSIKNKPATVVEGLENIQEITAKAYMLSARGDTIILSPACASFDIFKNYKDRGEQFKKEVMALNG